MEGCKNLTEAVRSVQLLKIDGFSAIVDTRSTSVCPINSRCSFAGYEFMIRIYPQLMRSDEQWVAVRLIYYDGPTQTPKASLRTRDVKSSGYLRNDSLIVQCTVTVVKELQDKIIRASKKDAVAQPMPVPSSDLHLHLGELLQSHMGSDATFVVSGESFAAHKLILAARSPVFKAQFFGPMKEKDPQGVEVKDMEPVVFKAMLRFAYTDMAPELDDGTKPGAAAVATMAQHLLAAADRYGLERLKLICEGKLSGGISVDTVALTLALAEQHGCSELRAKCVEFIIGSPERLDAVLVTEGYKHLVASCPLLLAELLKAARGRKN
ncbi:unnamed protein product [Urochloa decumbens]|uniref:BTB domain-containing protein n=1 Tax=Urochloa decumbens TaxID=240449 RepID=A0ABC9E1Z9_9POAL